MSKSKSNPTFSGLGGLVFSTDPDFKLSEPEQETATPTPDQQTLRIWLERGKGGKETTAIKGFTGSDESLESLAKLLKNKCAAGGSAKDGIILVQGDHRDKVLKLLLDLGYKNSKKAGG
ncbi:MAG: translation initiation factor [Saprospiraceae bacterium]|nr:translation initiation factor [Saprospiraceae bacterium]